MKRRGQLPNWLMATVSLFTVTTFMDMSAAQAQQVQDLGTIVVTDKEGNGKKELESDTVLGEEQLNALNAQTIQELFASTPSISVASGSTASQKFYVRGLDQAKANVVIDGARQRTGVWHHTTGDIGIEPAFLKRVDVKSGVSPADAGAAALAGTVAFETKDAKDLLLPGQTMGATVSTGYKSNSNTLEATGAAYAAKDGFEIVGIVKRVKGENYKDGGGAEELGTDPDAWNALGKIAYESGEGHRVAFSAERLTDTGVRRLRADMNLNGTVNYNKHTNKRTTLTAKYQNTKADGLFDPELLLYLNRSQILRPNGTYARYSGDFNSDMVEVGGKAVNTFHFDKGTITAGVDFYHNKIDLERFYSPTDADETISNVGALIQARFAPIERLEISAGARLDFQTYESVDGQTLKNTGFSPNLSASFELFDGFKVKAGAASIFGGIEPSEMALYASASPYNYSADLDPARSNTVEVGVEYKKAGLTAGATLFYTEIDNPLAYDYSNWPTIGVRVNGEDIVSKGVDLSVRYDWSNAYLSASYTHNDVEYGGNVSGLVYNGSTTVGDMITLQGAYTFEDYFLTVGALAQIALEIDEPSLIAAGSSGADDLKGYQAIDIFAEYKPENVLKGFTLRADVTNLLDQEYVARGTRIGGGRWQPIHSPGRSFNITATKQF